MKIQLSCSQPALEQEKTTLVTQEEVSKIPVFAFLLFSAVRSLNVLNL